VVWDPKTDEVLVEAARAPTPLGGGGAARAGAAAPGPALPPDATTAREELVRWIVTDRAPTANPPPLDKEDEERLRSLGYVP
jgi:hypothetical protein